MNNVDVLTPQAVRAAEEGLANALATGIRRGTTRLASLTYSPCGLYVSAVSDTGRKAHVNFARRTAGCDCPSAQKLKGRKALCKHVVEIFSTIVEEAGI